MSASRFQIWMVSWVFLSCGFISAAEPIPLPTDPKTPVIELWYSGPGLPTQREIAIYPNGRTWCRVGEGSIWGQLDQQTLQSLVHELLTTDSLGRLSTMQIQESIDQASRQSGLSAEIPNAAKTTFVIRTADQTYQIDAPSVGLLAVRFPEAQALQHAACAQRRLENVRAIVMVGGPRAAENLAKLACQRLQAEYGEGVLVTSQDLSMVRSLSDGTRFCQFVVRKAAQPATNTHVISLFEVPGEVPRVSLLPDGPQIR
ncbi:hypothetical protein [Planctomicrobium sp. SH664]|uniref:hypothetical protein n=1 Tax=Planctomicrobium sp. SH664 TaxID=3448125 RepID=UPI003F5BE32D